MEASTVPGIGVGQQRASGTGGFHPNDQFFRMPHQARLHSERALLNDMRRVREQSERAGNGNPLAGQSVRVRGDRPPCYNCHRAMAAFAQQNQMGSIDYVWTERPAGTDSMVRYPGSGNPQFGGFDSNTGAFSTSNPGPHATQLRDNYHMTDGNIRPGSRRDVNREANPGGYQYLPPNQQPGGMGARAAYEDANSHYN